MQEERFHQPDEALMWALLDSYAADITGVILRLAWREGLSRKEIHELKWEQVDDEGKRLRLPDRDVPLEEGTAACLRKWRALFGMRQEPVYVATSRKTRKQIVEQYISRAARLALDSVGMEDVRLIDLRHDFVRRMMKEYDWTNAIRVSGLSVTTYRTLFAGRNAQNVPTAPPEAPEQGANERLWQIMQENRGGPAGIALWLSQQANLTLKEIVGLTWEQVDLDKGRLKTEHDDVMMIKEIIRILEAEKAGRTPADDPHVVLTPRSRKPMDTARLSTLLRDLLVRNGLDGAIDDLRYSDRVRYEKERIMRQARRAGKITRKEVEQMLGVKTNVAYSRLVGLVESGELVRTSRDYIPAERAVPREKWPELICSYIGENGGAYSKDIAELLHIGKRTAGRLLQRMTDSGELVMLRRTQKYFLPAAE